MNWDISISKRLQQQRALNNIPIVRSAWMTTACQVGALLALVFIAIIISNWLAQSPGGVIEVRPDQIISGMIKQSIKQGGDSPTVPSANTIPNIIIPYILGWLYLLSSLWITLSGPKDDVKQLYAIFCCAAAVALACIATISISGQFDALFRISLALAGSAIITFSQLFYAEKKGIHTSRLFLWMGILPGIFLSLLWIFIPNNQGNSDAISGIWLFELIYLGTTALILVVSLVLTSRTAHSEHVRQLSRRLLGGLVGTLLPLSIWVALALADLEIHFTALTLIPLAVFPVVTSLNLNPRSSQTGTVLLQKTTTYALLSALTIIAYFLLVSGLSVIGATRIAGDNPLLIVLMVFLLAISLNPVRDSIQKKVDDWVQPVRLDPQQRLQAFAIELIKDIDIVTIVAKLQEVATKTISPSLLHLYLYDPSCNQYAPVVDLSGHPTSDLRFPPDSPLVRFLAGTKRPLEFAKKESLPIDLQDEYARLALLGADLFIPLPGQSELVGWLAVNLRRGYQSQEIDFLESLCSQAAVAIERSLVISNLERRVREMDVLTRIAQGVNITLDFDNILELIYAQTNLVIPTIDFRITLQSSIDNRNYHVFYLEEDERQAHNENINIPTRNGLEEIVIQNQRAIITPDYDRECRRWGVIPNAPRIYAWIGVPLNAGSETFGAISLGSRNPSMIFTARQGDLLQAIADQAAGAIVKTRLLAESERRARQLAKLNEVGRSLASTLDINPLLTQIMNSAVELLNCEAGSLIMIDENSHELVFEVTVGPIADDLAGTRLPAGTGLVGKVAETGQPVIANHLADAQTWIDEADQQTGFMTRDFLAVPLNVKETTIGVIEVINRLDGALFTQDDLDILSTFTSQAAVAVENARLYTHTDEALSARLEEMSVMQRVDRELNASLDVERTMRITLEWSVDYSNADAGMIGFIRRADNSENTTVNTIAHIGFDGLITHKTGQLISADALNYLDITGIPAVSFAVQEGQPVLSTHGYDPTLSRNQLGTQNNLPTKRSSASFLAEKSRSQLIIPIRRKSDVIGLILLESTNENTFTDDAIAFLTRLSDHAAIAISNALLYADLQAANVAKSEFVSLVSHELKTPMTSIRGYTDLLAQGTVGPINEIQSNFLNTIRSNVNRMANLVSDLADVSRIEAGRMRLEFGSVSISNIIEEVNTSVNAQLLEKDHTLKLAIPDDLPNVWGDHNRLIQVMNNLLSNAIKYTPQHGQIQVACQVADNSSTSDGAPEMVLVSVSDTGYGISPEDREKIFQKFFRSSDQNVRDVPGTGLGLNITRHLVEMQGGQIWFDSTLGDGTTFNFTIPVAATD